MPNVRVNGIEIAYQEYGEGFPLVLTHGYTATKEMWEDQVGPFSERYRTVVYDVRGHGESEAPPVDDPGYTLETLVEDQRALMDHLGIEGAHIGGLSLGGMIAMRFALAHPARARTLLLSDTSPGMDTQGQWAANRLAMEGLVRAQGVGALMRGLYAQRAESAAGQATRPDTLPAGVLRHIRLLDKMSADGFLGIARAAGDAASVLDRLSEIDAPTLIITGDADFFRGASEEMHRRIGGSRFELIKDSYHGTCLWQPEAFSRAVLDFLANLAAGQSVSAGEER